MLSVGVSEKTFDRNCTAVCYKCRQNSNGQKTRNHLDSRFVDFSSAFDTNNYTILIRRLRLRYGFVGKALDWVISYLKERTQRVVIGDQLSSTTTLTTGVPQGSVLGPLLFSLYVHPIDDGLFFHQYAGDLQAYAHFDLTYSALVAAAVKQMENCLDEVKVWMARNSMFMNDGKTQYLPIVPKSADAIVDKSMIRVGMATITASPCVQSLSVCSEKKWSCLFHKIGKNRLTSITYVIRLLNRYSKSSPEVFKMLAGSRHPNTVYFLPL